VNIQKTGTTTVQYLVRINAAEEVLFFNIWKSGINKMINSARVSRGKWNQSFPSSLFVREIRL